MEGVFNFLLLAPRTNCLRLCQTHAIVVVITLEVEVVSMVIFDLTTLASLSLDLNLDKNIFPPPIEIYPPVPAPYIFKFDL